MYAVVPIAFLAFFNVLDARNVDNIKARQNVEGVQNARPNVVMQSVVLGKKRPKTRDEEPRSPEEVIGKLSELLSEEDLAAGGGRRSLIRLEKIVDRIKSRLANGFEDYELVEAKSKKYDRKRRHDFCDSEEERVCRRDDYDPEDSSERFSRSSKYDSDEDYEDGVVRRSRWGRLSCPRRVCYNIKCPVFEGLGKIVEKPNSRKWKKQEKPDGKLAMAVIPKDVIYIPKSSETKFVN